jgi:hypothetical protein
MKDFCCRWCSTPANQFEFYPFCSSGCENAEVDDREEAFLNEMEMARQQPDELDNIFAFCGGEPIGHEYDE